MVLRDMTANSYSSVANIRQGLRAFKSAFRGLRGADPGDMHLRVVDELFPRLRNSIQAQVNPAGPFSSLSKSGSPTTAPSGLLLKGSIDIFTPSAGLTLI